MNQNSIVLQVKADKRYIDRTRDVVFRYKVEIELAKMFNATQDGRIVGSESSNQVTEFFIEHVQDIGFILELLEPACQKWFKGRDYKIAYRPTHEMTAYEVQFATDNSTTFKLYQF